MLFIGDINAGFPSAAEGYEDTPLNLHEWIVINPAATFFYKVSGDELIDEHIRNGSILVVDRSVRPSLNRLVVMESEGVFIVGRFKRTTEVVCGVITAIVTRL